MMEWYSLILAGFTAGLMGSPHCVGMCGAIVSAISLGLPAENRAAYVLFYHTGRIFTYALLGLCLAVLGQHVVAWLNAQMWLRGVLGLAFILLGLTLAGVLRLSWLEQQAGQLWQHMSPLRRKILPIDSFSKAFIAGMLWGLLPCGLVYSTLLLAMATTHAAYGFLTMLAFGIGTMPLLLGVGALAHYVLQFTRMTSMRYLLSAIWIVMGVWVMFPLFKTHQHTDGAHDTASQAVQEQHMHHHMHHH